MILMKKLLILMILMKKLKVKFIDKRAMYLPRRQEIAVEPKKKKKKSV